MFEVRTCCLMQRLPCLSRAIVTIGRSCSKGLTNQFVMGVLARKRLAAHDHAKESQSRRHIFIYGMAANPLLRAGTIHAPVAMRC